MFKRFGLLCVLCFVASSAFGTSFNRNQLPTINYVSFDVPVSEQQVLTVTGQYRVPRVDLSTPIPAVVILHTTAGIDSTGSYHAESLNEAGFATLELDLFGSRGFAGGAANRPEAPQENLPDAFAALAFLAQRPEIDANNIGILGFSWGGVVTMLSATEQYVALAGSPLRFKAHVAHYPVCWLYNNPVLPGFEFGNLTGAPVLIQSAEWDDYDLPETCQTLVDSLDETDQAVVTHRQFRRVYHTFDRLEPTLFVEDPIAHLGAGGEVRLQGNYRAARISRRHLVRFFRDAFAN